MNSSFTVLIFVINTIFILYEDATSLVNRAMRLQWAS